MLKGRFRKAHAARSFHSVSKALVSFAFGGYGGLQKRGYGMRLFGLALAFALVGCDFQLSDAAVYTLYRSSPVSGERVHVASFDAKQREAYNRENCDLAQRLYSQQPGVSVRYWCEKGRFRP